jgi:hypothetical protein
MESRPPGSPLCHLPCVSRYHTVTMQTLILLPVAGLLWNQTGFWGPHLPTLSDVRSIDSFVADADKSGCRIWPCAMNRNQASAHASCSDPRAWEMHSLGLLPPPPVTDLGALGYIFYLYRLQNMRKANKLFPNCVRAFHSVSYVYMDEMWEFS